MAKDDPKVRISEEQNQRISKLAFDAGFSKEQLIAMFLDDAIIACQTFDLTFPLPRIALIRLKLGLDKPLAAQDVKTQIANALAEQLPAAIEQALKKKAAPPKKDAA